MVLASQAIDQATIDDATRERLQLDIYRRQVRIEDQAPHLPVVLCDRGTVDAASYWPAGPEEFWRIAATTLAQQLARYAAVIWLESSAVVGQYHGNAVRTMGPEDSIAGGESLLRLWRPHPRLFEVRAHIDFSVKVRGFFAALNQIRALPT